MINEGWNQYIRRANGVGVAILYSFYITSVYRLHMMTIPTRQLVGANPVVWSMRRNELLSSIL